MVTDGAASGNKKLSWAEIVKGKAKENPIIEKLVELNEWKKKEYLDDQK